MKASSSKKSTSLSDMMSDEDDFLAPPKEPAKPPARAVPGKTIAAQEKPAVKPTISRPHPGKVEVRASDSNFSVPDTRRPRRGGDSVEDEDVAEAAYKALPGWTWVNSGITYKYISPSQEVFTGNAAFMAHVRAVNPELVDRLVAERAAEKLEKRKSMRQSFAVQYQSPAQSKPKRSFSTTTNGSSQQTLKRSRSEFSFSSASTTSSHASSEAESEDRSDSASWSDSDEDDEDYGNTASRGKRGNRYERRHHPKRGASKISAVWRWIGNPTSAPDLRRVGIFYTGVMDVENHKSYAIGDSAYIAHDSNGDNDRLVRIESLRRDLRTGEMICEASHFYDPSTYQCATRFSTAFGHERARSRYENELLTSDHLIEFDLTKKLAGSFPVRFPRVDEEDADESDAESVDTTFVCRRSYDRATGLARILGGSGGKPHLRARLFAPGSQSKYFRNSVRRGDISFVGAAEEADDADNESESDDPSDPYSKTCRMLSLDAVPDVLPCREKERDEIHAFMEAGVARGGSGPGLYIAGVPGTGKTATVCQVVETLKAKTREGKLPEFRFIELNGMHFHNPHNVYPFLWRALELEPAESMRISVSKARKKLDRYFSDETPKSHTVVLLIDEMDHLITTKQSVLYNLFNWPHHKNAGLVVLGIANTMDLPERLSPKIASRMGQGRVMFTPYNRDQIEEIIQARLHAAASTKLFDPDAVEICARRVANVSGDIRRALQICKRSVEIAKRDGKSLVTIETINAASREFDERMHMRFISTAGVYSRLLLASVAKQAHLQATLLSASHATQTKGKAQRRGEENPDVCTFETVYRRFEGYLRARIAVDTTGEVPKAYLPSSREVECMARALHRASILKVTQAEDQAAPTLELAVAPYDLYAALGSDPDTRSLVEFAASS